MNLKVIVTEKKKNMTLLIIVALIVMILIFLYIIFTGELVPYVKSEDIEVTISPEVISIEDYNQTISINVNMRNTADSDRRIKEYVYTYPTESVGCYFTTNVSSYIYLTQHVDIAFSSDLPEIVLSPNEVFSFNIDINLSLIRNYTTKQYLSAENPNSCNLYILLRIGNSVGESNEIIIERI